MVLDSSAVAAIWFQEVDAVRCELAMEKAQALLIGTPTLVELSIVVARRMRQDFRADIDEFLRKMQVSVIPFTRDHYEIAAEAFLRYGKTRHRASLNFGDCMSYAVAKVAGMPLLFTGDDFAQTDILVA